MLLIRTEQLGASLHELAVAYIAARAPVVLDAVELDAIRQVINKAWRRKEIALEIK